MEISKTKTDISMSSTVRHFYIILTQEQYSLEMYCLASIPRDIPVVNVSPFITITKNRLLARVCAVNNGLIKIVPSCSPCGVLFLKKV